MGGVPECASHLLNHVEIPIKEDVLTILIVDWPSMDDLCEFILSY